MRHWLSAGFLFSILLSGCTIKVTEERVFLPSEAAGTQISIDDGDRVLFDLNRANPEIWKDYETSFDTGEFTSEAGNIHYKLARNGEVNGPLFIYCGGNTFDVPNHGDLAIWKILPFGDVLVWDYPGFGKSEGEPTVIQFRQAVTALVSRADTFRRNSDQSIILWEQSLGGFVCSEVAAQFDQDLSLIIETSAPSAPKAANYLVPWYLKPFAKVELASELVGLNTIDTLDSMQLDILVLGGRKDRILPVSLSRQLHEQLTERGHQVRYHEFQEGTHFNLSLEDGFESVIQTFLASLE